MGTIQLGHDGLASKPTSRFLDCESTEHQLLTAFNEQRLSLPVGVEPNANTATDACCNAQAANEQTQKSKTLASRIKGF